MPGLVFTSPEQVLVAAFVLLVAQAIYVLFGFGVGLVAIGAFALLLPDLQDAVILLLLVNLPAELFIVIRSRQEIAWRQVGLVCVGLALGVPVGTWVLGTRDASWVLVLLGAVLIAAGTAFLLLRSRGTIRWPRWTAPPVGALAGVLAGMFGTGGPPLILWYQLGGIRKEAFRGNLMAIFLVVTLIRVPAYAVAGLLTTPRVLSSLALLPAALLGGWLGHRIHLRLEEATFRRLVSVALVVIGGVLLARQVL